ncbi:unnamed protein product [Amoebophrya sp. A25]|nr:unnamed protein product [Amoebophrya sp. A25]|eukprot:GSA25T00013990001.1
MGEKARPGEHSYERLREVMPCAEHENEFWIRDVTRYQDGEKIRSEPFQIGSFRYRLLIFPFGTGNSRGPPTFAGFVEADPPPTVDQERWMYHGVRYSITLINQLDYNDSVHKSDTWTFSKREIDRGWHAFISSKDLCDPSKGWINNEEDRACVMRVQCYCRNSETLSTIGGDYDSKKETGFIGLKNHGATCYLNCLLQTLFHIGKFRKLVYEADTSEQEPAAPQGGDKKAAAVASSSSHQAPQPPNLLKALQNSFYALQTSSQAGNCRELMRSFGWESVDAFTQHDYQELNRILLDKVEERLKSSPKLDGEIKKMFAGEQESYIECTDVDYASKKLEPFYDINLNLKTDDGSWVNSLEDAFRDYVKEEIMEGDNAYDASDGGFGKQRAKKGIRFKSLPLIFNILLKRFIFDLETLDTIKTNNEMRFPKRIDLSEYIPGNEPAIYTLFGVTVQTGTVSSGHYYCFLRPWMEEENEVGITNWIRFDDEQITRVTDYAAMHDNYGGDDLNVHDYSKCSIQELIEKQYWKRQNWPNVAQRISNAYILVYIREDQVQEMLKPPPPSPALVDRIQRDIEQKQKAKYEEQTRVLVQVVMERDLLAKQPCGFWDTQEGTSNTLLEYFDAPKETANKVIWQKLHEGVKAAAQDPSTGVLCTEEPLFAIEHFAMFVLRRRSNRQIRFSVLKVNHSIKETLGNDTPVEVHRFGSQPLDTHTPKMTVLALACNGYDPESFLWKPEEWHLHGNERDEKPMPIYNTNEEEQCTLIIKYFCPYTKNIMMLGCVYTSYQKRISTLLPWVMRRQKAIAEKYPTLCEPAPPQCRWGCFEEFSNTELKELKIDDGIKGADLYTGDILIWQPLDVESEQQAPLRDEPPCNTVEQLAQNIQNRATLRIIFHDASEPWAIDGVTAEASMWNAGAKVVEEDENGSNSEQDTSKRCHEFQVDLRAKVANVLQTIATHFGVTNRDRLWIFRHAPAGNYEEPLSPHKNKDEEAMTLKDLGGLPVPRQLTLHAVELPEYPKSLWRKQIHNLHEDIVAADKTANYQADPAGKSLSIVLRYFDEHVEEKGMAVLPELHYNTTAADAIRAGLQKFLNREPSPEDVKGHRLCVVSLNGKQLDIIPEDVVIREIEIVRRPNVLWHCLRLEKAAESATPPDGADPMQVDGSTTNTMTMVTCYHAERSNTTIPYGHPFFLPIYVTDTVPAIKQRVKDKLRVPEREFKQWRLGKVLPPPSESLLYEHAQRNLLRDEDSVLENFFPPVPEGRRAPGPRKICIEHAHPPGQNQHRGRHNPKARGALTIR